MIVFPNWFGQTLLLASRILAAAADMVPDHAQTTCHPQTEPRLCDWTRTFTQFPVLFRPPFATKDIAPPGFLAHLLVSRTLLLRATFLNRSQDLSPDLLHADYLATANIVFYPLDRATS